MAETFYLLINNAVSMIAAIMLADSIISPN